MRYVRYKVTTTVRITMFRVVTPHRLVSTVDVSVSEKLMSSALKMETFCIRERIDIVYLFY